VNLALRLERAADGVGERVAFGPRGGGLTYAALRDHATGIAAELDHRAPTVAMLAETSPLVPAALFGAAWAGASYAPLNFRLPEEARVDLLARLAPTVEADPSWLDLPAAPGRPFPDDPAAPAVILFPRGPSAAPISTHRGGMGAAPVSARTVVAITRLSLIQLSEPTRLLSSSYAVFCLKKKRKMI